MTSPGRRQPELEGLRIGAHACAPCRKWPHGGVSRSNYIRRGPDLYFQGGRRREASSRACLGFDRILHRAGRRQGACRRWSRFMPISQRRVSIGDGMAEEGRRIDEPAASTGSSSPSSAFPRASRRRPPTPTTRSAWRRGRARRLRGDGRDRDQRHVDPAVATPGQIAGVRASSRQRSAAARGATGGYRYPCGNDLRG